MNPSGVDPAEIPAPAYRAIRDPLLIIDADPLWGSGWRGAGEGEREECVEINRGKVLFVPPHKSARGHIFFELVIK